MSSNGLLSICGPRIDRVFEEPISIDRLSIYSDGSVKIGFVFHGARCHQFFVDEAVMFMHDAQYKDIGDELGMSEIVCIVPRAGLSRITFTEGRLSFSFLDSVLVIGVKDDEMITFEYAMNGTNSA